MLVFKSFTSTRYSIAQIPLLNSSAKRNYLSIRLRAQFCYLPISATHISTFEDFVCGSGNKTFVYLAVWQGVALGKFVKAARNF